MPETKFENGQKSTNDRIFYRKLAPLRWTFRILGAIAPRITGIIGLRLFRTPHPHPTPQREKRWLESAERSDIEVAGERFAVWSWGLGPTILLVHGWEGRGSQMGAFARALVEGGYRVVTFDGPAHGASSGKLASLPQFASAIRGLDERIGPLHGVVTHSFGSAATAWAMRHGLEVDRLVFIAPPADLDEYMDYFCELLGLSDRVRQELVRTMEKRFDLSWREVCRATLQPQGDTPLLVIHDRDDRDSAFANGETVSMAWPGSQLYATDGLGHRRILRSPAVVAEAVRFLSREPQGVATPVAADRSVA
jgi:pimeloyl-ACP methyl ester carboxylesterase